MPPIRYVEALKALRSFSPRFLVSAFDLAKSTPLMDGVRHISHAANQRATVLLDSGNYEAYWGREGESWTESAYLEVLSSLQPDTTFCYDIQQRSSTDSAYVSRLTQSWQRALDASARTDVFPIFHGTPEDIVKDIRAFVEHTDVQLVAVPERALGPTLATRITGIRMVRAALDETRSGIALHILGTGNPASIALFALAGADSFDALEWVNTVIDPSDLSLHHHSHAITFPSVQAWLTSGIEPEDAQLASNLEFYMRWMGEIRIERSSGSLPKWVASKLPSRLLEVAKVTRLL